MGKYLVTGSNGFIGKHLIDALLADHHKVICLVRTDNANLFRKLDVRNIDYVNVNDTLEFENIGEVDGILHLAWGGSRRNERNNINIQIENINFLNKLLEIFDIIKPKIVIGFGSQAEYGNVYKIDDKTNVNPVSEYGKYKIIAYEILKEYAKLNKINFVWLRLASIYGIHDYEETMIMSTINKMLNNKTVELTKCIQKWDYLNVKDLSRLVIKILEKESSNGIYNVASGQSFVLKKFINTIINETNTNSKVMFGAIPYGIEGLVNLDVSIQKLIDDFNWYPKIPFDEGIREIIESKTKI